MNNVFSNYTELKILEHLVGKTAWPQTTDLYLALSLTNPLEDATGLLEPTDANLGLNAGTSKYARVQCNNWQTAAWARTTGGTRTARQVKNADSITFAQAGATWGDIPYWAIMDAASGGNIITYGVFTNDAWEADPKRVQQGTTLVIPTGELVVGMAACSLTDYAADRLLDHIFKGDYYSPGLLYAGIGLVGSNPPSVLNEIVNNTNAYQRTQIPPTYMGSAATGADGKGAIANTTIIAVGRPSGGNWGNASHILIFDAATGGNLIAWSAIRDKNGNVVSVALNQDNIVTFPVGALKLTAE